MKVVIIYSGGMDSTVGLFKAVDQYGSKNVTALTFNYNSKHNEIEGKMAKINCKKLGVDHRVIDLSSIADHLDSHLLKDGGEIPEGHYAEETMKKTVVPFRNGIMLSVACGIAESIGATRVIIGNHAGDHAVYPDCRATFISSMSEAMAYGTYNNVNIISPFCHLLKEDIAKIGERLGVDWTETWSCYKGGETQCGRCSTCFERREAFYNASVEDPTKYLDQTNIEDLIKEYGG